MFLVEERGGKLLVMDAKPINTKGSSIIISSIQQKILSTLSKKSLYPKELASIIGVPEPSIYYHVRSMEKMGLIKVMMRENHRAAVAKYYVPTAKAFFVRCGSEPTSVQRIPYHLKPVFEPFIQNGELNSKIVVGSPDPHGPDRARSRDAYYGIDLALFIGTMLFNAKPCVKLDTELTNEDLKDNLIIVGGTVVNRITRRVNNVLPIRFDQKKNIYSSKTKAVYKGDDCGFITVTRNPFAKTKASDKKIIVLAGKRFSGTRAAILSFISGYDRIENRIVQGIDSDYDGIVDKIKILESFKS